MDDQSSLPAVSILLTCYKSPYLLEALQSVLAQSFDNFEVLILDDANDPTTRDLVEAQGDNRLRYLPATAGASGPAGNHDRGLQLARAELIAIINHDDLWKPELLKTLYSALMCEPRATVAFADHDCVDTEGRLVDDITRDVARQFGRANLTPGLHIPFSYLAVVSRSVPIAQAALWKRAQIVSVPRRTYGSYDLWIAYRLSRLGGGAVYVDNPLASWRSTPDNLTRQPSLRKHWGSIVVLIEIALDPYMRDHRRNVSMQLKNNVKNALKTFYDSRHANRRLVSSS